MARARAPDLISDARPLTSTSAYNLLLESELVRASLALRSSDIPAIVLKGVPLTRRLFDRLDARTMVDNDILVHRDQAGAAVEVLTGIGYQALPRRSLEAHLRNDFQFSLRRPVSGSTVWLDLHWAPWWPQLYPVDEELVWAHTEPFEVKGQSVQVFDRPLTLIHLAAHYAQHRFAEHRVLVDLATGWNRWQADLDLMSMWRLAEETGLVDALEYALAVADRHDMLDVSPPRMRSRRARRLLRIAPSGRSDAPTARRDVRGGALALLLADPRRLPRWLMDLAFPPLETLAAIHDRPVSRWLYLRYLTRPFQPLGRLLAPRR